MVVEYTTGPSQTTLNFSASISGHESGGYVGLEITDAPCAAGSSLHCVAPYSTGTSGQIFVVPSTTYYVWASDRTVAHSLPNINMCLW